MGLRKSFTLDSGIVAPDAYIKIDSVYFTASELIVTVSWYATQEARDSGKPKLNTQSYSLPYSSAVSLAECYTELKNLPDFVDSVDC